MIPFSSLFSRWAVLIAREPSVWPDISNMNKSKDAIIYSGHFTSLLKYIQPKNTFSIQLLHYNYEGILTPWSKTYIRNVKISHHVFFLNSVLIKIHVCRLYPDMISCNMNLFVAAKSTGHCGCKSTSWWFKRLPKAGWMGLKLAIAHSQIYLFVGSVPPKLNRPGEPSGQQELPTGQRKLF